MRNSVRYQGWGQIRTPGTCFAVDARKPRIAFTGHLGRNLSSAEGSKVVWVVCLLNPGWSVRPTAVREFNRQDLIPFSNRTAGNKQASSNTRILPEGQADSDATRRYHWCAGELQDGAGLGRRLKQE